ncbi:MAG: hypothetical protein U0V70_11020 [Terriglobia bacterium]
MKTTKEIEIKQLIGLQQSVLNDLDLLVQEYETINTREMTTPETEESKERKLATDRKLQKFQQVLMDFLGSCTVGLSGSTARDELRKLRDDMLGLELLRESPYNPYGAVRRRPQIRDWRGVRSDIQNIGEILAAMRDLYEPQENSNSQRIEWLGTDRQWGDRIKEMFQSGLIEAKSYADALNQASKHFVKKNGKEFNAKSVWQSLKNREVEGK